MLNLVFRTNGDALGVILFLVLIVYFWSKERKSLIEYGLMASCMAALVVDTVVVIKALR